MEIQMNDNSIVEMLETIFSNVNEKSNPPAMLGRIE